MSLSFRLSFFYGMFFLYVGMYVAYFPAYLDWRGLGAAEIAWVIALPAFVRCFAPVAWGWVADRSGWQRGIVVFSCAVNTACFALMPFTPGFAAIAWLIAASSAFAAAAMPLVETITLGALAGRADTHLGGYGPIRLWGSLGFIVAVLGGGAWLDWSSVEVLPAALALCSVLCMAAALRLPAGARHAGQQAAPLVVSRAAQLVLAAGFCMSVAHGALYAFFTLHLQREGYSGAAIGLFWTAGVLGEIAVFFYLPALFRRFALSAILVASFACAVLRFLAIGWLAALPLVLLAAQLLHAATFGSFHAASVAAIHRAFPAAAHARVQTLFSSICYGAGAAVGTLLAGWAWETAGPGLAFSISSGIALTGLLLAHTLKRAGL